MTNLSNYLESMFGKPPVPKNEYLILQAQKLTQSDANVDELRAVAFYSLRAEVQPGEDSLVDVVLVGLPSDVSEQQVRDKVIAFYQSQGYKVPDKPKILLEHRDGEHFLAINVTQKAATADFFVSVDQIIL